MKSTLIVISGLVLLFASCATPPAPVSQKEAAMDADGGEVARSEEAATPATEPDEPSMEPEADAPQAVVERAEETVIDLELLAGGEIITVRPLPLRFLFDLDAYRVDAQHSLQLNLSYDERRFDVLTVGALIEEINFFMPATGLAAANGYPYLWESEFAHHYVAYSFEEPRLQRAELLEQSGQMLRLSWPISGYNNDAAVETDFATMPPPPMHIAVLRDRNLNGIVDEGEVLTFTLVFDS